MAMPATGQQPFSFSFSPNYGSLAGGDTIRLTVQPAITGTPEVLFDGVPATAVTVVDAHTLTAVTPPHAEGAVVIQLRMNGASVDSFPYFAYIRPREATLIPFAAETPGGFGARWTTDIAVFNDSDETISLTPNYCFGIGAYFPCTSDLVVPPHSTFKVPLRGFPEMYLYPPIDVRDKLHFSVRVRDASRDDTGTEIPVVPLSSYRDKRTVLVNVPVSDRVRSVLRVYDTGNPMTVQIYDEVSGDLLTQRFSGFRSFPTDSPLQFSFSFFDVLSDPAVRGHNRVRIEIDETNPGPIPAPVRLWAMLTLTDNATQRVTVLTSQ
jgi:IPT/TIG domain-containing protein